MLAGHVDDKSELLKHDVEKMIRVQANAGESCQPRSQLCQLRLECFGRYPHNARSVRTTLRPPVRGIVATVRCQLAPSEGVPDAFVGDGQAIHGFWTPEPGASVRCERLAGASGHEAPLRPPPRRVADRAAPVLREIRSR